MRELCHALSVLQAGWHFTEAFLNQDPKLDQAVDYLRDRGCTDIRILPLLVFKGKHTLVDIPNQVAALRLKYPGLNLELELHLSRLPGFKEILLQGLEMKSVQESKE